MSNESRGTTLGELAARLRRRCELASKTTMVRLKMLLPRSFEYQSHRSFRKAKIFAAACCALMTTSCRETIVHNVEEGTANRIALVLAQAAIESEKVQEGNLWNVVVSDDKTTEALATIEEQRVLRPSQTLNSTGSSGNFLQSRDERLRGIERERASTLEETLERLPGVREARVHLIFASEEVFDFAPRRKRDSASVLIIHGADESVAEDQVKRLVSGGAGISQEAISVVITEQPKQSPHAHPAPALVNDASGSSTAKVVSRNRPTFQLRTSILCGSVFGLGLVAFLLYKNRSARRISETSIPEEVAKGVPNHETFAEEVF